MKYFKLKQIALALLMVVLGVGCIEDSEPTPMRYTAYGFLNKTGEKYYVDLDGGMKVELAPFDDSELEFEGDDRVLFMFTVEKDYGTEAPVRYLVNVLGKIWFIDYSDIVELNAVSRDTIGDGYVELEYTPVPVGDYLNLNVFYKKQEGDHVFSLCYDPESQVDDEPVVLELKHKKPEEGNSGQMVRTYQSYNLSGLMQWGELDSENKMKFTLRINSGDSQQRDFNLIYAPIQE
ncbi:NigD-like protein [Saccharicrinis carchari]|uniref:NigD-like protein n=1 Tax=Saccharicrinis carchari TaxID=1168039 RepID=A0A521B8C9_SACCC|nr:hypothetical protein [Saccharicrinis carchari]SMO42960.1 NigD-like protein [Saccharicrinis carchari]